MLSPPKATLVLLQLTLLVLVTHSQSNLDLDNYDSQIDEHSARFDRLWTESSEFTELSPVLLADAFFSGTWTITNTTAADLFHGVQTHSGLSYLMYYVDNKSNQTNVSMVLTTDSYRDSPKVYFTINLTNSSYNRTDSSLVVQSTGVKPGPFKMRVLETKYGTVYDLNRFVPAQVTMQFKNKSSGEPLDIRTATNPQELETSLEIKFLKEQGTLRVRYTFDKVTSNLSLWRYLFVLGSLVIAGIFWTGMVKFIQLRNHFLFARTEFAGLAMLCMQLNQLFGLVLIDALESEGLMMKLSSVILGVAGCLCGSVCVLISVFCNMHFVVERFGNGEMQCSRCKLIMILGGAFLIVFFLTLGMAYHMNPYVHIAVIMITSSFPLIHITETAYRKSHKTFQPWIQLVFWPLSLYFSLILRAVGNPFINLTPFPWVGVAQVSMLVFGITVSYLQSQFGPRFFLPYKWQSGLLKIRVSPKSLTPEQQETECCICYGTLGTAVPTVEIADEIDKTEFAEEDQTNLESKLISAEAKEAESSQSTTEWISKPKCGHLYHESCLKNWLVNKQQCPLCKAKIEI